MQKTEPCLGKFLVLGPFLTERIVKHWNGLSREVVGSPSLELLKKCSSSNWTWHLVPWPCRQSGDWSKIGLGDLEALFQPQLL